MLEDVNKKLNVMNEDIKTINAQNGLSEAQAMGIGVLSLAVFGVVGFLLGAKYTRHNMVASIDAMVNAVKDAA